MTISDALVAIHAVKPNQYDNATLIRWLSDLDGRVYEDVLSRFEDAPEKPALPYKPSDQLASLLIPFPHEDVYVKWLGAQIEYNNADFDRYNNSMMMFEEQYQSFVDAYTRSHTAKTVTISGVRGGFA